MRGPDVTVLSLARARAYWRRRPPPGWQPHCQAGPLAGVRVGVWTSHPGRHTDAVRSESAVMATGRWQACQADSEARRRRPPSRLLVSHGPSRGRRRRAATCPPAAAPCSVTGGTTQARTVTVTGALHRGNGYRCDTAHS